MTVARHADKPSRRSTTDGGGQSGMGKREEAEKESEEKGIEREKQSLVNVCKDVPLAVRCTL